MLYPEKKSGTRCQATLPDKKDLVGIDKNRNASQVALPSGILCPGLPVPSDSNCLPSLTIPSSSTGSLVFTYIVAMLKSPLCYNSNKFMTLRVLGHYILTLLNQMLKDMDL